MTPIRSGRRVALLARYPVRDRAMPQFIPNLGLYMVEAALRAARLPGLELRVWDLEGSDVERVAAEVIAFDPDVVGCSVYLWSFPFFLDLAVRLKDEDPRRLIVFGGPSARPVMLQHAPHGQKASAIDVLVISEGEHTFRAVVELQDRRPEQLSGIAGLALRKADAWHETPARPLGDLNELASPYAMNLVPGGGLGVLQTYRGCPFTCTFCEWGTLESPKRVRTAENLGQEFSAMERLGLGAALLADAGLNLNQAAFNNLRAAAERSGFLSQRGLICEIYPAKVRREHLDFLKGVGNAYVGVGLQSFDNKVLANVERKYDEARFDETLAALGQVATPAVEIIVGLPGDSPESFRRNFERARRLPCALRVYHCVVLPSALMVRSPAEHRLDYDPLSLKMRSCLGWSREALAREAAFLTETAAREDGRSGEYFWVYPPPGGRYQ
ncbi:MAG TPA: radical SAM protein [Xanthobacteraceae bacterium]|nr:radical SAM protein [Xanthobacteraceae bacterium]